MYGGTPKVERIARTLFHRLINDIYIFKLELYIILNSQNEESASYNWVTRIMIIVAGVVYEEINSVMIT